MTTLDSVLTFFIPIVFPNHIDTMNIGQSILCCKRSQVKISKLCIYGQVQIRCDILVKKKFLYISCVHVFSQALYIIFHGKYLRKLMDNRKM